MAVDGRLTRIDDPRFSSGLFSGNAALARRRKKDSPAKARLPYEAPLGASLSSESVQAPDVESGQGLVAAICWGLSCGSSIENAPGASRCFPDALAGKRSTQI